MLSESLGLRILVPGWPRALFRIAFGLLYLDMALQKAPWINFGWLEGFVQKENASPAFAWYAVFLKQAVLPNFTIFAMMTFLIEFALGVGLLFGVLTRLVALAGFLWQVNIALGAFNVPGEWFWIWPLLLLPLICFAFTGVGQVLGVDRWLAPALRRLAEAGANWAKLLHYAT